MRSKPRAAAGAGACDLRVPQPGRVSADRQVLLEQVSLPLPLLFGPPNYGEANYFNKVRYTIGEGALPLFFFLTPNTTLRVICIFMIAQRHGCVDLIKNVKGFSSLLLSCNSLVAKSWQPC